MRGLLCVTSRKTSELVRVGSRLSTCSFTVCCVAESHDHDFDPYYCVAHPLSAIELATEPRRPLHGRKRVKNCVATFDCINCPGRSTPSYSSVHCCHFALCMLDLFLPCTSVTCSSSGSLLCKCMTEAICKWLQNIKISVRARARKFSSPHRKSANETL